MTDGEKIKLEPMDAYDKPNHKASIKKIVDILGDTNSEKVWSNLHPFLTGIVLSKINLPAFFYEKIARKAAEQGKDRIIMNCAERSKETGFTLRKRGVAKELMLACHHRAALADFKGTELETAARRAEQVSRILENELHGGEKLKEIEVDARTDPLVASVLTELAAARAVHALNGEDEDGKVANCATKMLHLEAENQGKSESDRVDAAPKEIDTEAKKIGQKSLVVNSELVSLLPMQNAMRLALQIGSIQKSPLGEDLRNRLKEVNGMVESRVKVLRELANGKPRRGLLMYDQIHKTKLNPVTEVPAHRDEAEEEVNRLEGVQEKA
ncbi:uncharacterized protein Z518_00326 [Rhinocladiella mackenziei CBS 650.93]|uniref:Uncharacterized protein n=1 Tax=Rhinocladiella mackenziei CBS 650.93 TaxID=1442369 RepID=A0A0D2G3Q8_9EURO|nr:uncharacterized protein Z518_00326 [Rhinocladiella mackenziei CBS 650.93]KIX09247.1 hypothetical protein Z518_00326 [Rhinocladiella mackenziei CBS 650.93]